MWRQPSRLTWVKVCFFKSSGLLGITDETQVFVSVTFFCNRWMLMLTTTNVLGFSFSGTTVVVSNLFNNLPVRKQFYKTVKKKREELKKVEELVMSFSIIRHDVRFTLRHNKEVLWQVSVLVWFYPLPQLCCLWCKVFTCYVMWCDVMGHVTGPRGCSSDCVFVPYDVDCCSRFAELCCSISERCPSEVVRCWRNKFNGTRHQARWELQGKSLQFYTLFSSETLQPSVLQGTLEIVNADVVLQVTVEMFVPKKNCDIQQCSRSSSDWVFVYVNKRPVSMKQIEKVEFGTVIGIKKETKKKKKKKKKPTTTVSSSSFCWRMFFVCRAEGESSVQWSLENGLAENSSCFRQRHRSAGPSRCESGAKQDNCSAAQPGLSGRKICLVI